MFISLKEIDCPGLRYPKIFSYNKLNYLIGSKKYEQKEDIVKYGIYLIEMDDDFNLISEGRFLNFTPIDYLKDIFKSGWIRDINIVENELQFILEIKQNVNNEYFEHNNYLMSTSDLINFSLIKKYDTTDFLYKDIIHDKSHFLFTAKIEKDHDNPEFNWGIYLINLIRDNKVVIPTFDKIVDYKEDKGHVIGNVVYDQLLNKYTMYFSIRHKVDKSVHPCGYKYEVYKAFTTDLIHYYNTQKVEFNNSNYFLLLFYLHTKTFLSREYSKYRFLNNQFYSNN